MVVENFQADKGFCHKNFDARTFIESKSVLVETEHLSIVSSGHLFANKSADPAEWGFEWLELQMKSLEQDYHSLHPVKAVIGDFFRRRNPSENFSVGITALMTVFEKIKQRWNATPIQKINATIAMLEKRLILFLENNKKLAARLAAGERKVLLPGKHYAARMIIKIFKQMRCYYDENCFPQELTLAINKKMQSIAPVINAIKIDMPKHINYRTLETNLLIRPEQNDQVKQALIELAPQTCRYVRKRGK